MRNFSVTVRFATGEHSTVFRIVAIFRHTGCV